MPRPKGVSRKERAEKKALEKKNAKQKNHLENALLAKFATQPEVILAFMNSTIDKMQDVNTRISKLEKRADVTKDAIWDCYLEVQWIDWDLENLEKDVKDLSTKSKLSTISLVIAIISLIISGVTLYLKLS